MANERIEIMLLPPVQIIICAFGHVKLVARASFDC